MAGLFGKPQNDGDAEDALDGGADDAQENANGQLKPAAKKAAAKKGGKGLPPALAAAIERRMAAKKSAPAKKANPFSK